MKLDCEWSPKLFGGKRNPIKRNINCQIISKIIKEAPKKSKRN